MTSSTDTATDHIPYFYTTSVSLCLYLTVSLALYNIISQGTPFIAHSAKR